MIKQALLNLKIFPTPSSSVEYPECDGIRGIAILIVFGFHYLLIFGIGSGIINNWNVPLVISYSGAYGVQLFFVLSAYLLFYPQYSKIKNGIPPQPINQFFIRRFMRIAPLYYLSIVSLILFVDVGISGPDKFRHTILHLLFIHVFFEDTAYSINNVAWSLGVEFIFYLFLPVFIYVMHKLAHLKSEIVKRYSPLIIFSVFLIFMIPISVKANSVMFASIASFFFGLVAASVIYRLRESKPIHPVILTSLGILVLLAIVAIHYDVFRQSFNGETAYHYAFVNGIWKISGLYALVLIIASQKDWLLYRILAFYPIRIVGLVSYEMYLIHLFLMQLIPKLPGFGDLQNISHILNGVVIFFICLLLGMILHVCISRPFIAISGFLIRRSQDGKLPVWMSVSLVSFCFLIILPTLFLL